MEEEQVGKVTNFYVKVSVAASEVTLGLSESETHSISEVIAPILKTQLPAWRWKTSRWAKRDRRLILP